MCVHVYLCVHAFAFVCSRACMRVCTERGAGVIRRAVGSLFHTNRNVSHQTWQSPAASFSHSASFTAHRQSQPWAHFKRVKDHCSILQRCAWLRRTPYWDVGPPCSKVDPKPPLPPTQIITPFFIYRHNILNLLSSDLCVWKWTELPQHGCASTSVDIDALFIIVHLGSVWKSVRLCGRTAKPWFLSSDFQLSGPQSPSLTKSCPGDSRLWLADNCPGN